MASLTEEQVNRWLNILPENKRKIIDLIRENEELKRKLRRFSKGGKDARKSRT